MPPARRSALLQRLHHSIALIPLAALALAATAPAPGAAGQDPHAAGRAAADTLRFEKLEEVRDLFAAARYTRADWRAGERSIPRYYLAHVPGRWRHDVAPELPPELKKEYFLFVYAPLVLESNEAIGRDRARLLELAAGTGLDAADTAWLRELAVAYALQPPAEGPPDAGLIAELKQRVDSVPPSLALAQAAVESGWSTSRFSDQGNALFGQWTWGEDGITPTEQRDELGNYKIRAFATPEASIAAYMRNLNTHRSYADFRRERELARAAGRTPTGTELAPTLIAYSEKGQEYVDTLLSVIRRNGLPATDEAYLRDMRPLMLLPVGEGSD